MMKLSRRDFIHAGCTAATVSLIPSVIDKAEAWTHGSALVGQTGISQRSVLNVNFVQGTNDYAFIDHTKCGTGSWSPFNSNFLGAGNPTYSQTLDANGWPSISSASGQGFGGQINIPDPANFGGPYIIDGVGNGSFALNTLFPSGATATFTIGNGSNGMLAPANCTVTFNSGGTLEWDFTGGASQGSFQFTLTTTSSGPQVLFLQNFATGASGFFAKNIRFYRASDATDLAAGKIFRAGWKQPIVNLCPSAVRTMSWLGGNNARNNRWENRTLPGYAGFGIGDNWVASPNYQTDATGNNQMVVAAATPTTGIPKNTPTNMVHGELATFRIPSTGGGQRMAGTLTASAITNGTNGQVTTSGAHGYNTGDIIGHYFNPVSNTGGTTSSTVNPTVITNINNGNIVAGMFVYGPGIPANTTVVSINSGANTVTMSNSAIVSGNIRVNFRSMQNLHLFPCTITVVDATHYNLNVNTTSMGTFSTNAQAQVYSYQFQTLQVGSGGNRTAYPASGGGGSLPLALFGNTLTASSYQTAYFDKTVSLQTDGSGNYVAGAWLFSDFPGAHSGDVPVEVCTALINELNAMSPAHTIGLWVNIPAWGLSSMDPDHTSGSDWAVNCLDTILNPSSSVRVSGYSALGYSGATKLNSPVLIVEYSNEPWNSDEQNSWLQARGIQHWPTIYAYQDLQDMQSLRSTCMARDIKAGVSAGLLTNTKIVLGMQAFPGMGTDPGSRNYCIAFAGNNTANPIFYGDWYASDPLVTGGSWGTPISNHDGMCAAPYFNPPDGYFHCVGAGSFVDDSAMYNGTDNSAASISWTATISGNIMTVTGSPTQPINQAQIFTGAGIPAGTYVTNSGNTLGGLTGFGAAGTYQINRSLTIGSSTTMSNAGVNYTGAANKSQANTNFVAQVVDVGNLTGQSTTSYYQSVAYPQFSTQIGATKLVLSYEGGANWQTYIGSNMNGNGYIITTADSAFLIGVLDSSQWATAQINSFNAICAIGANVKMPSIFIAIQGGPGPLSLATQSQQDWAYCSPDSYATITGTPTEGAALTVNSPTWVAMGNRNQALPS